MTGAMGKPQIVKRVPIVKHENQLILLFLLCLFPFFSPHPSNTLCTLCRSMQ